MNRLRVILVHLRTPRLSDPNENRADPFYELGSFGCTRCHSKNLMNPKRANELEGARFGFAQGGPEGFKLVYLTPPAGVIKHSDRCEITWPAGEWPFRYGCAPLLVNREGETEFPELCRMLAGVDRATWPGAFSSKFRSSRTPLPSVVAREVVRVFGRRCRNAAADEIAGCYGEAMPAPPPLLIRDRRAWLEMLRAEAQGESAPRRGQSARPGGGRDAPAGRGACARRSSPARETPSACAPRRCGSARRC